MGLVSSKGKPAAVLLRFSVGFPDRRPNCKGPGVLLNRLWGRARASPSPDYFLTALGRSAGVGRGLQGVRGLSRTLIVKALTVRYEGLRVRLILTVSLSMSYL